jgi:hypothetical protein
MLHFISGLPDRDFEIYFSFYWCLPSAKMKSRHLVQITYNRHHKIVPENTFVHAFPLINPILGLKAFPLKAPSAAAAAAILFVRPPVQQKSNNLSTPSANCSSEKAHKIQ